MSDWRKWVRVGFGLILAIVVFVVLMNILGDYRTAKRAQKRTPVKKTETGPSSSVTNTGRAPLNSPTSTTGGSTGSSTAATGKVVIVVVDGVNMRSGPSTTAKIIKALKKNDRLTYLAAKNGYYQVVDKTETKGWVSANRDYTRLAVGK